MTLLVIARAAAMAALWRLETPALEAPGPVRLIERPCLHLGLRPALANEGAGFTLQLSVCAP